MSREDAHHTTVVDGFARGLRSAATSWLKRYRRRPNAALRLYCFSYSGGGASVFREWHEGLPPEVDVCAVQLPGREERLSERPFVTHAPLVLTLTRLLELDRPYAFFGHSAGALLAFELARELRRRGRRQPICLLASGALPPDAHDPEPPISDLPDERFLAELRRLEGTPEALFREKELMALLMPTLRADFALHESYRYAPEPPLDVPITALAGEDDHRVPPGSVDGWRAHTTASFTKHVFPGNHFFLRSAQARVLELVSRTLLAVVAGRGL